MLIQNAKYIFDAKRDENIGIQATINGELIGIPLSEDNRHYIEILKQVADGDITITEAD